MIIIHKFRFLRTGWIGVIIFGLILLTACIPVNAPEQTKEHATLAVQTLEAGERRKTLAAFETLAVELTQMAQVTPSLIPTTTFTPTPIPPTRTPRPRITPTKFGVCNWAYFVTDVSIPDGTKLKPGETFTKTWRLKNLGACTWDGGYNLVFDSGKTFGAPTRIGLPKPVLPGETVDISVLMESPVFPGGYAGYWMLADGEGNRFGAGTEGYGSFWVKIVVSSPNQTVYNFTDNVCKAAWYSGSTNPLPCPGSGADIATGFVISQAHPIREDGAVENEAGLITSPDNAPDTGKIVGIYPAFTVQKGDVFKAVIGCEYNTPGCNVIFDLRYRADGGSMQTLSSWHQVYEGQVRSVTVDLSALAGRDVAFALQVRNNGVAENNRALWILPRIMR